MRLIVVLLFFGVVTHVNAASCPAGYVLVDVPDVSVADTCPSGTVAVGNAESCTDSDSASVCWIVEKILELCGAGISVLKTSNGVSVPLYAEKYTSPALHIRYNGQVCYANLTQGKSENAINIRYGGVVYHVVE